MPKNDVAELSRMDTISDHLNEMERHLSQLRRDRENLAESLSLWENDALGWRTRAQMIQETEDRGWRMEKDSEQFSTLDIQALTSLEEVAQAQCEESTATAQTLRNTLREVERRLEQMEEASQQLRSHDMRVKLTQGHSPVGTVDARILDLLASTRELSYKAQALVEIGAGK